MNIKEQNNLNYNDNTGRKKIHHVFSNVIVFTLNMLDTQTALSPHSFFPHLMTPSQNTQIYGTYNFNTLNNPWQQFILHVEYLFCKDDGLFQILEYLYIHNEMSWEHDSSLNIKFLYTLYTYP
jgi:hypothetical protein